MLQTVKGRPKLNDAGLLRKQAYLNGEWVGAAATFDVNKQSGLGREGSKYGIDEYLEIKYLCMGGI